MTKPIITLADIEKIGALASLELSAAEKAQFVQQFEGILGYFQIIDRVPLPDLHDPHDHDPDAADHLRDDLAVSSGVSPDTFSPHLENGHFKVPKVLE